MADYNINAITRRVVFTGSAGLGPYAFTFEVLDENDVAVYFNTTLLTLTTDYTVTINANGTGSVTIVTGSSVPSTPTASDSIIIVGARDIERVTDFVTAGDLLASSLNEQLDALTIFDQQLAEENARTLRAPVYDPALVADGGTLDMTLPAKAARAGKYLQFNSTTGNPEAGPDSTDVTALADIATDIATLADIEDGTDATDAIQTVAGISANVTTVAGIASNVSTVAGIQADVTAVAGDATDIGTVATNIASVNTVAGNISDVIAVANDLNEAVSEVETVANDLNEAVSEIETVAASISNVDTVGTNIANVNTVAGIDSNVTTVAGISANVTTVAGISGNVTTVAGISGDVTTVAADGTDIGTVAGAISNVNTVAGISGNVTTVAGISGNVTTVASNIADVNTVAGSIADVNTFAVRYRIAASAPTTSLDEGDLYFNTTDNQLYVYNGSAWQAASPDIVGDTTPQLGGNLDLNGNDITGTGNVDITGTLTADGLTVDGNIALNGSNMSLRMFESDTIDLNTQIQTNVGKLSFKTVNDAVSATTNRLEIDHATGDISFFSSGGASQGFYWDASTQNLGLGTTGPASRIDGRLSGTSSGEILSVGNTGSGVFGGIAISDGGTYPVRHWGSSLEFYTGNSVYSSATEAMRIDSSGNVGIGTSSPASYPIAPHFVVDAGTNGGITIRSGSSHYGGVFFADGTTGNEQYRGFVQYNHNYAGATDSLIFGTSATEKMRIDSSGNVGIGQSNPSGVNSGSDDLVIGDATGNRGLTILSGSTSLGLLTFNDGVNTSRTGGLQYDHSSNYLAFRTSDAEKMRIDSSGNVGIGTSSPVANLDSYNSAGTPSGQASYASARFGGSSGVGNGGYIGFDYGENHTYMPVGLGYYIDNNSGFTAGSLVFKTRSATTDTAPTERLRIDKDGNVGIGTSSPLRNLDVVSGGLSEAVIRSTGSNSAVLRLQSVDTGTSDTDGIYLGRTASAINYLWTYENEPWVFATNNTEAMRIDSSGNLLVGGTTGTAGGKLTVTTANAGYVAIEPTSNVTNQIATGIRLHGNINETDRYVGIFCYNEAANNVNAMTFWTTNSGASSERMRLDSAGRLLVDRTSPYSDATIGAAQFQVNGVVGSRAAAAFIANTSSSLNIVGFVNSNGTVGTINVSGTSTSYNTSSDYRLKENVTADWDATTRLKQLNPVRFNFISDADTTVDGFLAHEVQSVVPEAITGTYNEVDADGNPVYQGIDQSKLVPLLVKTIQELEARIAALEAN